jgi:hypothetical protein
MFKSQIPMKAESQRFYGSLRRLEVSSLKFGHWALGFGHFPRWVFIDTASASWLNMIMKYLNLGVLLVLFALLAGCAHDNWSYRAVPDITISRPDELDNEGRLVLKMEPDAGSLQTPAMQQWLHEHPAAAAKRTVLMASWRHESAFYSHSMGRTLVIFLDGAPKPGEYWINPDNAVLITYSAYSPPSRERVALVGSVTIDEVGGRQIVARLAVRDTTAIDTSLFLDHPWDPVNRTWPFTLRGKFTFDVTEPGDPLFEKSAIKWVTHDNAQAAVSKDF